MRKNLLLTILLIHTIAAVAAAEKVDVTKSSAGFDLSYSFQPLGGGLGRQWSVLVSPDGSIQYRGAYQEQLPVARVPSCSERAGIFYDQLESSEHQQLMELALAAMSEQQMIKEDEINKETRQRSSSTYTMRTELGEKFSTALIVNDEGEHTQKLLTTINTHLKRTYQRPRQAMQLKAVRQKNSWQLTFTSLASQVQTFVLPSHAHEAFFLIDGLGSVQKVSLEYAQKPKKFIHKLKPGEKVLIEIAIPQAAAQNQRPVFDNKAIRHHGGGEVLQLQLCSEN